MNPKFNRSFLALVVAALFALVLLPVALHAADVATSLGSSIGADNIVQWLTPVLVPLVIAGFKKFAPSMPSWTLPLLAPIIGVGLDLINSYASGHASNLVVAALLGLAGVGLREVKDQLTPAKPGLSAD